MKAKVKHTLRAGMSIATILVGASGALAQHAGHSMPGPPSPQGSVASSEAMNTCVQSSQQTLQLANQANARLEAARQTNSPAEMRAAMDDLQAALVEMKTQLSGCLSVVSSTPAGRPAVAPGAAPNVHESHTQPGTPVTQPAARTLVPMAPGAQPPGAVQRPATRTMDPSHRGHTMPAAPSSGRPTAEKAVDPVCAMTVDPKTAPKATFQGKAYYFCSEADKEKFLKDPAKFMPKP